ncbi:TolC family protein [Desulfobacula phenolica]|uniref:Outer membrane protein n=1 Tax=Desulfobacula phenolica TaxID=90732 RepID=A0A1H2IPE1_9BACT|nr:TolC family protein [Desulfobacula phenolica]SDU46060.1 outer membrane protein [Desulfobacula phenolica]
MIKDLTEEKIRVIRGFTISSWMTNKQIVFLVMIVLFLHVFSWEMAQASEIQKMSLVEAVELALKKKQDLKLAKNSVQYSMLLLKKEKNDYLPQVTGTANTTLNNNYGQSDANQDYYTQRAEVFAQLNLFKGFEDKASLESAYYDLSSDEHAQIRQQQQVIYDTMSAYINVVQQFQEIEVARENLTTNRQQEKEIKAFHEAGKVPATDLYQQQAETAKARFDFISAENNYKISKMQLIKIIGVSIPGDIEIEMPEIKIFTMTPETDTDRLIQAAFETRPDLLALEKNVSVKEAEIKKAASGKYPSVDLNTGMGSLYDNRCDEDFGDQFSNDNLYSYIGVSVSLPIFDRQLTRTKVNQAKIDKQSANVTLEKLKQQIREELGQAVADYQTACESIMVSKSRLFYTNKALESVFQRYKMGVANLTELTQIRSDQVEARNNKIKAEMDKILKTISIFFYKGDLGVSHILKKELL